MAFDTRRTFHNELVAIRDDVLCLAALVEEAITCGTEVLLSGDLADGRRLIDGDVRLNRIALDIEDRCYQQLALQQPMASDLRALVTAIRLTSELERSGDLMVNVAKSSSHLCGIEFEPKLRGLIQTMSDEAFSLLHLAIDTYVDGDATTAATLGALDDVLDDVHRRFVSEALESCRSGALPVEAAVQLALIGRYYERIGDHAVNIGEKVHYLVSGCLPAAAIV